MPSGNSTFINLLKEIRAAIPKEKIISVAAFPPPQYLRGTGLYIGIGLTIGKLPVK